MHESGAIVNEHVITFLNSNLDGREDSELGDTRLRLALTQWSLGSGTPSYKRQVRLILTQESKYFPYEYKALYRSQPPSRGNHVILSKHG